MTDEIKKMLEDYRAGKVSGIQNALRAYANDHPEELIDTSGNNLDKDDPMFRFYNPRTDLGDVRGQNWWPEDPRNNPDTVPPTA